MITIYKYKIGSRPLTLPKHAQILSVGIQEAEFFVWAKVDSTQKETTQFRFKIYGTGWNMSYPYTSYEIFIGTVFEGNHVWHVFYYMEQ